MRRSAEVGQLELDVDRPFYVVPVDRYGRALQPIRVNDPEVPEFLQWRQAIGWGYLAIQDANDRPPGWVTHQTLPG